MRKLFDKELYTKHDTSAKKTIKKIFKDSHWSIKENEKKTAVDFLVFKNNKHIAYLEVEVKMNWNTEKFPYDDVQWPERKKRYAELDKPTIFLIFNHDLSQYLTTTGEILLNSKLEMVRNKYVRYGENFFKVPIDKIIFNNINKELKKL